MPKRKDVKKAVENYFKEEEITNLMYFGETGNKGLADISEPFAIILTKLGIVVKNNYAEEKNGDGKYLVYLEVPELSDKRIEISTKAWYDADQVAEDICDILEDGGLLSEDPNRFEIQIALIDEQGYFVSNSDLLIGFYNSFEEAKAVCDKMDFQTPSMYEVYINEYDKNDELVTTTRVH